MQVICINLACFNEKKVIFQGKPNIISKLLYSKRKALISILSYNGVISRLNI